MNLVAVKGSTIPDDYIQQALGSDPIMWVWGVGSFIPVPNRPGLLFDTWAYVVIQNDTNYQRCARRAVGNEDLVMVTTFRIPGNNGRTLSYMVICADGQAWIDLLGWEQVDLYKLLDLPRVMLNRMSMDRFQTLDFALLTEILNTPIALQGMIPTAPENQVTGYYACQQRADPYNAGM